MNNLHERLLEERKRLGLNQDQLAEFGGVKKRAQVNYESGERCPDGHYFSGIATAGANVQYILTGVRLQERDPVNQLNEPPVTYHADDYIEIPRFDVQFAAGNGKSVSTEEQVNPIAFRREWLRDRRLSPRSLLIVDVKGDSMEPHLFDGDMVLVDRDQIDVQGGKTYVLRINGHLLVKNLQLLPQGLVQIASYNNGLPYQADLSDESLDMQVIGRVVASMHEW